MGTKKILKIGEIGETAVVFELLKRGCVAMNINSSFRNYQNADLVCMNANNGKSVMVQVKTGTTDNILVGLTSDPNGTIRNIDSKVVCPWVFVRWNEDNDISKAEFYILTQKEVKDLIRSSNDWYVKGWFDKNGDARVLKNNVIIGVNVKWLRGESEKESADKGKKWHKEYKNPLNGANSLNRWDKITDLLR